MDQQTLEAAGLENGVAGKDYVTFDGKSTITGSGNWNSTLDTYAYRFTVVNVDGFAALCGVRSSNRVSARLMNQFMNDLNVKIAGTTIVQGFGHFTKVEEARAIDPGPATCKRGNVPWQDSFADNDVWDVDLRGDGRYRG